MEEIDLKELFEIFWSKKIVIAIMIYNLVYNFWDIPQK